MNDNEQTTTDTTQAKSDANPIVTAARSEVHIKIEARPRSMEQDAHNYMVGKNSIPGSEPPYQFVGWELVENLARKLGHPLTLANVKVICRADGKQVKCAATGIQFQPVAYWLNLPDDIDEQLNANGGDLSKVRLRFGYAGAYFEHRGEIFPIAGPRFDSLGRGYATYSNMVKAAARKATSRGGKNRFMWGGCREKQEDYVEEKKLQRKVQQKAEIKLNELFGLSGGNHRQARRDGPERLNGVKLAQIRIA